jgi:squalene-hopene/tetraprenyl-beta-curcumene cyclase
LGRAIQETYGADRTFSVPILTMCALAGRLGGGREAWQGLPALPFELAVLPRSFFRHVGLPVVSYALPALIAIGQAQHRHRPSRFPPLRWLRDGSRARTLRLLAEIQPESGGFLEAVPLTSFVAMSLASLPAESAAPVIDRCAAFLAGAVRDDGSWPIDVDLATWVTTLSVNALPPALLGENERRILADWLLGQHHVRVHPFTQADPGGWAWTDLPGGVPDADDTAGALLALARLAPEDRRARAAAELGVGWLLGLANRDGGIPTFCRGWGRLPFDRSAPDLTGHALRAWHAWRGRLPASTERRLERAAGRAAAYLARSQRTDGSWVPLWFGNQAAQGRENPTYGTSRVVLSLAETGHAPDVCRRGARWLVAAQNRDGGWGGALGVASSTEETALAVEALGAVRLIDGSAEIEEAGKRGAVFLLARIDAGDLDRPAPIGLYFADLWYSERLYPVIFTAAALGRWSDGRTPSPSWATATRVYSPRRECP